MKTSPSGLELILQREGCVLHAYVDPATGGEPITIGVGHTGGVKLGDTCTHEQALAWLASDAETAERCVNQSVRGQITQSQFDALVSLVFNIGCGNFRTSTVLRELNDGNDEAAAEAFGMWNRANGKVMAGLTTRRTGERGQFLS